jgi:hypothetical protein
VTLSQSSDERLKKDIQDAPLGLGFIRKLRPRIFRWRETPDTQAQEAAKAAYDAEAHAAEVRPFEDQIAKARERLNALAVDHRDVPKLEAKIEQARAKIAEVNERNTAQLREAQGQRREGKRPHYGLVAQEVKDALDSEGVDAAFWQQGPDGLQAISYTELVSVLIRGMQEQQAQIEELTQRVAVLEG